VPGYGGPTASPDVLAGRIRETGRSATVVRLAGNGTGGLSVRARVLDGYVNRVRGGFGPGDGDRLPGGRGRLENAGKSGSPKLALVFA
jgi:hypothetical protein